VNISDTLKSIAIQGAIDAGARFTNYPDDPLAHHVEQLAFKLSLVAQDNTLLALITDEEIEALTIEVKEARAAQKWIKENLDEPF
jgi:hypothetical protein